MIKDNTFSSLERNNHSNNLQKFRTGLEILVAFLPILVLGILGTTLGTDTLLGGTIVTLGYPGRDSFVQITGK
jgi:undecaprenyl pyrophosphate phosphatase UppP